MANEIWKDIPGHPGYQVSNLGRVKSLKRTITVVKTVPERILRASVRWKGNQPQTPHVDLNGKILRVSKLVMFVFVGECPKGKEVAHNDGNVANNALANLRYDTSLGNHRDRYQHGTIAYGHRNGSYKHGRRCGAYR